MGYKTKSMIKQASGLSANYLLKKELNKYTNLISEQPKQGESVAQSTKKLTTTNILKSKDSARDRDEKKQIRRAGREAARNTDVDFVKATPMGSDYFSLMAATAENLASRGAGKRKARKAAKSLKKKIFSEGRDAKPIESKVVPIIESKETTPSSSNAEIKVPKKTGKFKTLPTTPRDKSLVPKIEEKVNKSEPVKDYLGYYGPPAPPSEDGDKNRAFGRKIYDVTVQTGKDARRILTPEASQEMTEKQRAYNILGMPDEARKVGSDFAKNKAFAEDLLLTGTNIPSYLSVSKSKADKFDANLEQGKEKKAREIELKEKEEIEAAKRTLGIQMTGDGFNKGMSRKNKYKK